MMSHPQAFAKLVRRKIWFGALTPERQKQFIANHEKYPDDEIIALAFGGGCMRPEDSGFASGIKELLHHADYIITDSQGGVIASFLNNFKRGIEVWMSLAGRKFINLTPGETARQSVVNYFKITAYDIAHKLHSDMHPPIDMDVLAKQMDSDAYKTMRPKIVVTATRLSDGKLAGFIINDKPIEKARDIVLAGCRLLGVAGDPVMLSEKPDFVLGFDGKLEPQTEGPVAPAAYGDTVYGGHPINVALALGTTQFGMYCNRSPERMENFDTWGTKHVLTSFLKRFSTPAFERYETVAKATKDLLSEGASTGKVSGMATSLVYDTKGALTQALETDWGKLKSAYDEGYNRAELILPMAREQAAKLPALALPADMYPPLTRDEMNTARAQTLLSRITNSIGSRLPSRPEWMNFGRKQSAPVSATV